MKIKLRRIRSYNFFWSLKTAFFILAWTAFLLPVKGQGFLKADGQRIVNGKGENVLLRGIGLGGWMLQEGYMLRVNGQGQQHKIKARIEALIGAKKTEEFYDAWLSNHTRKIDIDSMKAWGFNSVRLPMHYNLYTLPVDQEPVKGENTWLQKGFALTDSLLAWCKANQMYLILDMHAAPGGQGNDLNISDRDPDKPSLWENRENQQKMIMLWKKLAERYANEPWIGGYDIINEPNWGFQDLANDKNGLKEQKNEPLRSLMVDITKAIREVDQKHLIIIEGNGWGNNYNGILPVWDSNMALSFHKYWNYNDPSSIKHILKYREQYNVPVWLGETGENSNVWFTDAVRLLEQNNIGWAWWPLKKIGGNNPLEISSNANYQLVLNYWSDHGQKPGETEAYKGLLELANNARLENTIYHKDVVDALIRQPHSVATKPFNANVIAMNSTLHAVDYDLGRNGYAYFDKDTANYRTSGKSGVGNKGGKYRNDGVDIRKDSSSNDGYYISDMEDGEWLQYTLNVARKGKYTLRFNVSSVNDSAQLSFSFHNSKVARNISVPNTNGNNNWKAIDINRIELPAGKQVLRLMVRKGGCNLKSIQFMNDQSKRTGSLVKN
ncbi:cellulase family glycosylhydrolase [Chitinophagaceae bacterium LB-8]|uniref:Cellulase family glycosylhydrolase n=1 Tax=Paraflavisolibacter caeni TaxID=2982496 RepID=A0A9X3B7X6_9BACT|nr:cellulase family glycosylhydrolase [Paraflavisolibacter caeni]MCU7549815.1 cellulase family glycosylhydrolase [Paraflavisolibacter caeni]